jgi:hypothetical protein
MIMSTWYSASLVFTPAGVIRSIGVSRMSTRCTFGWL